MIRIPATWETTLEAMEHDESRKAEQFDTRPLTEADIGVEERAAIESTKLEKHIVLSDYHYRTYISRRYDPKGQAWVKTTQTAHDPTAMAVVELFMQSWQPTHVHYNGDFLDFHQISRFEKEPGDSEEIEQDILGLRAVLKRHRRLLPDAQMDYELGNHEERWLRYLRMNAVELRWLTSLTYHEMLDTEKLRMEIYPYKERVPILPGILEITHGDKARARSGATAQVMLDLGISGVSGHTHRLGMAYRTNRKGTIVWAENGCLCRLDPEWLISPDWQQGFTIIWVDREAGRFHMEQIPILQGSGGCYRAVYAGTVYEVMAA